MNTLAIAIGLFFGLLTAALGYGVSMLASGLFARPVYRLYARVLIAICSVMLVSPFLRWFAIQSPWWGSVGLSIAQYAAFAILGYGVWQFNRRYLKRIFLDRSVVAFFIFGTLAYATVVTLVFLHVAFSGAVGSLPSGHGYITAAHYGPLLVLLAMMVFDTDVHLAEANLEQRRFRHFTFVGYALSFVGLAVSTAPLIANGLDQLELIALEHPWIPSLGCAQALLLAILLYGWLVWRYETTPPLFLLLVAIIAEYHVLVTQWVVRAFGPESWGLASLPLFVAVASLEYYFSRWDERKLSARDEPTNEAMELSGLLRFVTPFRIVEWGLGAALLAITFWTRFFVNGSPLWAAATFAVYSVFFLSSAVLNSKPALVYVSGGLAILSALCGSQPLASPSSVFALGCIAAVAGGLAWLGETRGLKRQWRTPLADVSISTAVLTVGFVLSRHFFGVEPYHFHAVGLWDGLGSLAAMVAFIACAVQYRSQLPTFGVLVAAVAIVPTGSAGLGLLATIAAFAIDRWIPRSRQFAVDDRVHFASRFALPLSGRPPSIWSIPLSTGGIPLALLGFTISVTNILQNDFTLPTIAGVWTSAIVMLLLTRSYREAWLYVLGILATYVAVYATTQRIWLSDLPFESALAAHVAIASMLCLIGWLTASVHTAWCTALLRRVAEEREASIRSRQSFYSGWLFHVTAIMSVGALFATGLLVMKLAAGTILFADLALALLFALAASTYRTKIASYLSLIALTLFVFSGVALLDSASLSYSAILASLGLLAATISCLPRRVTAWKLKSDAFDTTWLPAVPLLSATGRDLWMKPLANFALAYSPFAVLATMQGASIEAWDTWLRPAPLTYMIASLTWLLSTQWLRYRVVYVVSILFAFASAHSAAQVAMNLNWIRVDGPSVHLMVASVMSLVFCLVALFLARTINARIARLPNGPEIQADQRETLLSRRDYYAGTLHHCSLIAGLVSLAFLAAMPILETSRFAMTASIHTVIGIVLVLAFLLSGIAYRSRIQTYAALLAVLLTVTAIVYASSLPSVRLGYEVVALACLAVVAAAFARWMYLRFPVGPIGDDGHAMLGASDRWTDSWTKPPLPLLSNDFQLWAKPMAHAAVCLAIALFFPWLRVWGNASIWVAVVPIFLAAATFGIASATDAFGPIGVAHRADRGASSWQHEYASDARLVRAVLYVLSILAFGLGVHATAHLAIIETLPDQSLVPWHLAIAADLAVIGWGIASSISLIGRSRGTTQLSVAEPRSIGESPSTIEQQHDALIASRGEVTEPAAFDPERERNLGLRGLYSGLLHHITFVAGLLIFAFAATFGLPSSSQVLPLAIASGFLTLLFALAGLSYQSKIGSYLSLATLGMGVAQLSSLADPRWGDPVARTATAFAVLGLGLMALAFLANRYARRTDDQEEQPSRKATLWANPIEALRGRSWSILWRDPLSQASLIFVLIGLGVQAAHLVTTGFVAGWAIASLATLTAAAGTFLLAARFHGRFGFTYAATALILIGSFPLLHATYVFDARLGVAWSLMALAFWLVGYGIERACSKSPGESEEDWSEMPAIRIFEKPMIRSSAIVAVLAIFQTLLSWGQSTSVSASLNHLLLTTVVGAAALLLNARSMNVLHRFSLGRMLVYVACIAITVCFTAVILNRYTADMIGPGAAMLALVFAALGIGLMTRARGRGDDQRDAAESMETFAYPFSRWAVLLAIGAATTSLLVTLGAGGFVSDGSLFAELPSWFDSLSLEISSLTFVIGACTLVLSARSLRNVACLDLSVAFGSTGVLLAIQQFAGLSTSSIALLSLLAMNLLVAIARAAKFRPRFHRLLLTIDDSEPEQAFCRWPLVVATTSLVAQSVYLFLIVSNQIPGDLSWPWLLNGLLCAVLFFHAMYVRPHISLLHLLVASTVVGYFGASLTRQWDLTVDVSLASLGLFWAIIAVQFDRPLGNRVLAMLRLPMSKGEQDAAGRALDGWTVGLTYLAVAVTVPIHILVGPSFPSLCVTLFLASVTLLIVGKRWRHRNYILAAALLMPACLTTVAWRYVDPDLLLHGAALAIAVAGFLYVAIAYALRRSAGKAEQPDAFLQDTSSNLIHLAHLLTGAAVVGAIASMVSLHASPVYAIAMCCVALSWLWIAWESGRGLMVYAASSAMLITVLYVSTRLFGLPFTRSEFAAFALIGYSFAMYAINVLTARAKNPRASVFSEPTYFMALLAPAALVLVTPLDSPETASLTSLAAASFYLLVSQQSHSRWTLYVAAAFFNTAVYLWLPAAHAVTGLMQLYVIPAAITVLVFAQLHRQDLTHRALNGIRMAAAGAILAVSTFEVFFAGDARLIQFVAVLLLSLGGIAVGISLRIRPFVAIGIAFLIINVLGQLGLSFHHEAGVIRAVILIGTGLLVLGAMIFFNIHRERLVTRYRGFLADERWE